MSIYASLRGLLTKERRNTLGAWWVILNIAYDALRALIINTFFSSHGVNGVYYLAFCLFFSAFFGLFSYKLIIAFVDDQPKLMINYAFISGLAFFAPDIYVVLASHDVPSVLYASLALYLLITSSITVYSLRKNALKQKNQDI